MDRGEESRGRSVTPRDDMDEWTEHELGFPVHKCECPPCRRFVGHAEVGEPQYQKVVDRIARRAAKKIEEAVQKAIAPLNDTIKSLEEKVSRANQYARRYRTERDDLRIRLGKRETPEPEPVPVSNKDDRRRNLLARIDGAESTGQTLSSGFPSTANKSGGHPTDTRQDPQHAGEITAVARPEPGDVQTAEREAEEEAGANKNTRNRRKRRLKAFLNKETQEPGIVEETRPTSLVERIGVRQEKLDDRAEGSGAHIAMPGTAYYYQTGEQSSDQIQWFTVAPSPPMVIPGPGDWPRLPSSNQPKIVATHSLHPSFHRGPSVLERRIEGATNGGTNSFYLGGERPHYGKSFSRTFRDDKRPAWRDGSKPRDPRSFATYGIATKEDVDDLMRRTMDTTGKISAAADTARKIVVAEAQALRNRSELANYLLAKERERVQQEIRKGTNTTTSNAWSFDADDPLRHPPLKTNQQDNWERYLTQLGDSNTPTTLAGVARKSTLENEDIIVLRGALVIAELTPMVEDVTSVMEEVAARLCKPRTERLKLRIGERLSIGRKRFDNHGKRVIGSFEEFVRYMEGVPLTEGEVEDVMAWAYRVTGHRPTSPREIEEEEQTTATKEIPNCVELYDDYSDSEFRKYTDGVFN